MSQVNAYYIFIYIMCPIYGLVTILLQIVSNHKKNLIQVFHRSNNPNRKCTSFLLVHQCPMQSYCSLLLFRPGTFLLAQIVMSLLFCLSVTFFSSSWFVIVMQFQDPKGPTWYELHYFSIASFDYPCTHTYIIIFSMFDLISNMIKCY